MSDERPTEQSVTEETATERTATEGNPANEGATEENAVDESPTEENPADGKSKATAQQKSEASAEENESAMNPRVKASLLWGVVGLLAFLVLVQGYELVTGFRYSLAVKAGAALLVGVGAASVSYVAEARLFE